MAEVTVQRIVFAAGFELPAPAAELNDLYIRSVPVVNEQSQKSGVPWWAYQPPAVRDSSTPTPRVISRTAVRVPEGAVLSTDTYFNRVNAGYWRRWAQLDSLILRLEGSGVARVSIRRSTANGEETTVKVLEGDLANGVSATVDIKATSGGGTLWVEVEPLDGEIAITDGRWVTEHEAAIGKTDIAVCTFNRPEDVLALITSLRRDQECLQMVDQVWLIDNGAESFTESPGAQDVIDAWGASLHHIKQSNLGGSGGFARGQFEAAYHGRADFVTLLDDDVVIEPEGVRRAVVLASLARWPIAVGGQMLNRADPKVLHCSSEWVQSDTLRYGPAPGGREDVDLTIDRQEYVLDAAYNAWWCCLIPTEAIRKVGLGLPLFIKYDDVEFGYRLARAGYRTVTMPGCAVWHEPFTLKDDTTDWTLYFHVRNRLIFAAMMSADLPAKVQNKRVGAVLRDVLKRDVVRNVLRRAYASAASAELAMNDFLAGPSRLEEPLADLVARVRAARADYPDAETAIPGQRAGDRPVATHRLRGPRVPWSLPRSVAREYGVPVPKVLPFPPV